MKKILTVYLSSYYGNGKSRSNEAMYFGDGLFASLGWEETHLPLEQYFRDPRAGIEAIKWKMPFDAAFIVPFQNIEGWVKEGVGPHCPVITWWCDIVWRLPWCLEWFAASAQDFAIVTDGGSADQLKAYEQKAILSNWACRPDTWSALVSPMPERQRLASFHGLCYGYRKPWLESINLQFPTRVGDPRFELLEPAEYYRRMAESQFSLCMTSSSQGPRQMKGRLFEPQLFRSVLVTEPVVELERYWEPGVECLTFTTPQEAGEKMAAMTDAERIAMSDLAYRRAISEHTYQHRFEAIFREIGL